MNRLDVVLGFPVRLTLPLSLLAVSLLVAAPPSALAADWPTPAGDGGRSRAAPGALSSEDLAPVWTVPTAGRPSSVVVGDIDGDLGVEVVVVAAGRARAYQADGTPEWVSAPLDLESALPPVDLDGDGRPELVLVRSVAGIAVLRGVDGSLRYASQLDELSRVGRVLVRDLDGDGRPELIASETDCGPNARWIGRTVIYDMAGAQPVERFRLQDDTRDYNCSTAMATAQLDGTGAPEIVAVGHRNVYVYSGESGELLHTLDIDFVPYGRATPWVADVDGDGRDELLFATNSPNPYGSRRLFLVELDPTSNDLRVVWQHAVASIADDRHEWPDEPLLDLDLDGQLEVVHSIQDGSSGAWTTWVRNAATGEPKLSLPGRIAALEPLSAGPRLVLKDLAANLLTIHDATGAQLATLPGDTLLRETVGFASSGRSITRAIVDPRGWLIAGDVVDADAQLLDQRLYRFVSPADGTVMQSFTARRDDMLAVGRAASALAYALALEDGRVDVRDQAMSPTALDASGNPRITTPAQVGSAVMVAGGAHDALVLGRASTLFDAAGVSLGSPATARHLEHTLIGLLDIDGDGRPEAIGVDTRNTTAVDLVAIDLDGNTRWSRDGLVSETVVLYKPVVSDDLDGDGVLDVLLQTGDVANDRLLLHAISGATGQSLWSAPADGGSYASSGAATPLALRTSQGPRLVFGPRGQLRILDGSNGVQLGAWTDTVSFEPIAAAALGTDPLVFTDARLRGAWYAVDPLTLTSRWGQHDIYDANSATYRGSGQAFVDGPVRDYLVEGRAALTIHDHNFAVVDASTGALVHRVNLEGGQVRPQASFAATVSVRGPVALGGAQAHVAVGTNDGWVYILDLDASPAHPSYPANLLVRALAIGAPVGDISAADLDGDGDVELLVPTFDGQIIVFDNPRLELELQVFDTDCDNAPLGADIDQTFLTDRFCARWTAPPPGTQVDGYRVTLIDRDTRAPMTAPRTVTGTQVSFDGLSLSVGATYAVQVQGFAGHGRNAVATATFESDGATVVNAMSPPTITLEIDPRIVVPFENTSRIRATLRDASRLADYTLIITGPDGAELHFESSPLNGVEHIVELTFDGLDPVTRQALPRGLYPVRVEATDFDGLSSFATDVVEVAAETPLDIVELDFTTDISRPDVELGIDLAPDSFADTAPELGTDFGRDAGVGVGMNNPADPSGEGKVDGCCTTVRSQPSRRVPATAALALLALGGLVLVRRRRRR